MMERITFHTKAQNLAQLYSRVSESLILDYCYFTVAEWMRDPDGWAEKVLNKFGSAMLIVRSSSLGEDSHDTSMAGQFDSILNVRPNINAIKEAVGKVIESYKRHSRDVLANEVLIQPMLTDVACSGVLFTRTLETLAPYYVINYDDESSLTDSITSGSYEAKQVVMIYKHADQFPDRWKELLAAANELEELCGIDSLDIEFALDSSGKVYLFQVRPMVKRVIVHSNRLDINTRENLKLCEKFIVSHMKSRPGVYGERTIFGQMPDWNPAEIIGSRPKPLAYSLYRYLIMDHAWRESRRLLGYQSPESHGLMVQIAGRPYVDVRASFHSLLPAGLSPHLSNKLVNFYLRRLHDHPHFHDKIEFYIVHSCFDFTFNKVAGQLAREGFSEEEIAELKDALVRITDGIVLDEHKQIRQLLQQVDQLQERRRDWEHLDVRDPQDILSAVSFLLKDTIVFGTIPFGALARCAFIGNQLLRSLVETGVISEHDYQKFLNGIETVAGQYSQDMESYAKGKLSLEEISVKYGHLRPGTYDITTPRYDERPDIYFIANHEHGHLGKKVEFRFTKHQLDQIDSMLAESGLHFSSLDMVKFVEQSISLRESIKFEFTKNISLALKYISVFGNYFGFNEEELAFVPIEKLFNWNQESLPVNFAKQLRQLIDDQKYIYQEQAHIVMPDLIRGPKDLYCVQWIQSVPNFITGAKIVAEAVCLDGCALDEAIQHLEGKIVLVEQADPGFDWVFSRNIGGLVTKFGGVASHMAIRCAEFGIPAAIGCGEMLYNKLKNSSFIDLDCGAKSISPCEGFR